jgi:hypothetical protein
MNSRILYQYTNTNLFLNFRSFHILLPQYLPESSLSTVFQRRFNFFYFISILFLLARAVSIFLLIKLLPLIAGEEANIRGLVEGLAVDGLVGLNNGRQVNYPGGEVLAFKL